MKQIKSLLLSVTLILAQSALVSYKLAAQENKILAKFIIQDARVNKVDFTEYYTQNKAFLVFYNIKGSEDLYLASYNPGKKTQSWGRMLETDTKEQAETATSYEVLTTTFKWSYSNDYDNKSGTSFVKFVKIYKEIGVAFECTIIPENLDVIVLKGYMEGSIKIK